MEATVAALAAIAVGAAAWLTLARRRADDAGRGRNDAQDGAYGRGRPRWDDRVESRGDAMWSDPSMWSDEAERAFTRARRRADRQLRRAIGHRGRLVSFSDVTESRGILSPTDRGTRTVPLVRLVGSVEKAEAFTRSFDPRSDELRSRWKQAYAVAHGLRGYHPVELYQVGEDYFVVDGHFRISVIRALGGDTINAHVIEWH